jgi:hypothetical protein
MPPMMFSLRMVCAEHDVAAANFLDETGDIVPVGQRWCRVRRSK